MHRFQNVGEVLAGLFLLLLCLFSLAALVFFQPGRGHDGDHAPALGVLFQQVGHGDDSRAGLFVLVGGLAVAKIALVAQERAKAANVSDESAVVVAQVIAAFVGARLAVGVGIRNGKAGFVIAAFLVGGNFFVQRLENDLGGGDGEFHTIIKSAVFAPFYGDDRGAVLDGVCGGGLFDESAVFVAGADGLFPAFQLFGVFTRQPRRLGGGVHLVDGFHVGGGGVAFGQGGQLGGVAVKLCLPPVDLGADVLRLAPVVAARLLGVLLVLFQFGDILRLAAHGRFERGGAGVLIEGVRRGQGGAVAVEIVGIKVGFVLDGEQVAGEVVIIAGADCNAVAAAVGEVVTADQLPAVYLDAVPEKADGFGFVGVHFVFLLLCSLFPVSRERIYFSRWGGAGAPNSPEAARLFSVCGAGRSGPAGEQKAPPGWRRRWR